MEIPLEKQYEFLTSHLRYINDKIYQSFTFFIKIATTVIGGVFLLHWKLPLEDPKRNSLSTATDLLFILISLSMLLIIWNNLRSWRGYRKVLSEKYPEIPPNKSKLRWITEITMSLVIVLSCVGFLIYNPL